MADNRRTNMSGRSDLVPSTDTHAKAENPEEDWQTIFSRLSSDAQRIVQGDPPESRKTTSQEEKLYAKQLAMESMVAKDIATTLGDKDPQNFDWTTFNQERTSQGALTEEYFDTLMETCGFDSRDDFAKWFNDTRVRARSILGDQRGNTGR
ncbi:hypothetical protein TREMEDRAFT_58258 [Tremella mesenterica DSM 1558]|uniref:uncharacterized protein n=1 Tax=Tremella mesenterica (strain ATCC 24925 / CBS 8224 / DSM 1558 / NBRC 9311 / NRRL Y-6157 / RJB 2259-6 / UBC 559-6) TaxID=578456 RepID=UPI0003F49F6B|nr:uncharacterized protein TREMEDRAFT_58258 [Tremella mesenterica DSM 1558]EIW72104.1 hypothetical protein TREMEDRAFT_58258 [Tremella mesenterica DSM 1558]